METKVLIVMGSENDREVMSKAERELERLGIGYETHVSSAHRNPKQTTELIKGASGRGIKIIIAGAGMAAALPGFCASVTELPVIGVPIASGTLAGMDSLLAIAQMPPGVPVATVAINGAKNAALLASRILGLASGTDNP